MRIYISGPYTHPNRQIVEYNILRARDACAEVMRRGHIPFCPHTMFAHFEDHYPDISYASYLRADLEWLSLCDAILVLYGWEASKGSVIEHNTAVSAGIRVYYSINDIPVEVDTCQYESAQMGSGA